MSLASLFATYGANPNLIASQVGCSYLLFDRVDQRRQALPRDLAAAISAQLGITQGEVEAAAGTVCDPGPLRAVPLPPDPLTFGDALPPAIPGLSPVVPPVPSPTRPLLLVAGNGLGGGDPGAAVLDRNTGTAIAPTVNLGSTTGVVDAVQVGQSLWMFGGGFAAELGTNGALVRIVDEPTYMGTSGVAYSAEAGLWVCTSTDLVQVDQGTALPALSVTLPAAPVDAVAVDALVYATAGNRLYEVDTSGSIVRTSTGDSLRIAAGVAYDPTSDTFWVVSRTPTVGLFAIPRDTFIATEITLGFGDPTDLQWVEVIPDGDLYATLDDGGCRLVRLSKGGDKLEDRALGGSGAGRVSVDADGGLVWCMQPGTNVFVPDGVVHGLAPGVISSSAAQYVVGGVCPLVLSFRA